MEPHPLMRDYLPEYLPKESTVPETPGIADHAAPPAPFVKRARKFVVAACGVAAMVVSTGVLHESAEVWVNAALALATAAGVYQAKNAPSV